jgi:hypothetical protein
MRAEAVEALSIVGETVGVLLEVMLDEVPHGVVTRSAASANTWDIEELLKGVNVALKEMVEGVHTTTELINPAHGNQSLWILMGSAILIGYLLGTLERHTASSPGQSASSAERQ